MTDTAKVIQEARRLLQEINIDVMKNYDQKRQWRPIETAPKDGSEVLVICSNNEQFVGYRYNDAPYFCYAVNRDRGRFFCEPTHWMPLPSPPKDTAHVPQPEISQSAQIGSAEEDS